MILDTLAERSRVRCARDKQRVPLEELRTRVQPKTEPFAFERALGAPEISFICELKKASPSKGIICETFRPVETALSYQANGAAAISCLTEPDYFLGSDEILKAVAEAVDIPVLRKDFTVDVYQIYQAAALGADAVLLIVAILSAQELSEMLALCDTLGLSALVEVHDAQELKTAVDAGARVIGVNNRDLRDFTVDIHNAEALAPLIPPECCFVSESGIQSAEDVLRLAEAGADALLVGERLMRSADTGAALEALRTGRED